MCRACDAARAASGLNKISNRTLKRWFHHALQYGETSEESKRFNRHTRRGYRSNVRMLFEKENTVILKNIVLNEPQLLMTLLLA